VAALVVDVSRPNRAGRTRLDIFPGGATPAVHPADAAFWVGYGFAAAAEAAEAELGAGTRFELEVDGSPVEMRTDAPSTGDPMVRKTNFAEFPAGLPAGWHDFSGRWYERGKLILTSRASVEFVAVTPSGSRVLSVS
jgi:hypothetical protein